MWVGVCELVGECVRIILHLNVPKIRTNAAGRVFAAVTLEHLAVTWNKDGAITAMGYQLPLHRAVSRDKRKRKNFVLSMLKKT